MKTVLFYFLGLIFFIHCTYAQTPPHPTQIRDHDYGRIIQKVNNYNPDRRTSKKVVVAHLQKLSNHKHEQLFAIYYFLASKFKYDYSYSIYYADRAWGYRKGVCNAFSELFIELCTLADFECEKIIGLAKGASYPTEKHKNDIEEKGLRSNHAWNKVKLYGNWYLMDVTWAACLRGSAYRYYWLPTPESFIFSHLPLDQNYDHTAQKWVYTLNTENQYLEEPVSYRLFTLIPDPYVRDILSKPEKWHIDQFRNLEIVQ